MPARGGDFDRAFDDHGKPVLLRGASIDITTRKQVEEELFRGRKLESLGVLAGGIAHDFNNFLTTRKDAS